MTFQSRLLPLKTTGPLTATTLTGPLRPGFVQHGMGVAFPLGGAQRLMFTGAVQYGTVTLRAKVRPLSTAPDSTYRGLVQVTGGSRPLGISYNNTTVQVSDNASLALTVAKALLVDQAYMVAATVTAAGAVTLLVYDYTSGSAVSTSGTVTAASFYRDLDLGLVTGITNKADALLEEVILGNTAKTNTDLLVDAADADQDRLSGDPTSVVAALTVEAGAVSSAIAAGVTGTGYKVAGPAVAATLQQIPSNSTYATTASVVAQVPAGAPNMGVGALVEAGHGGRFVVVAVQAGTVNDLLYLAGA